MEPIEVLRFADGGSVRYVTLGCSRYPMTPPEAMLADPIRGPRAELVLTVAADTGPASGIHRTLAVLAAAPSVEGIVLAPDVRLELGEPLWNGAVYTAVTLRASEIPDLELPAPADPVRFFEAEPTP